MDDHSEAQYFICKTLPYGYTRAPSIARALMKPVTTKLRRLGGLIVVFYDDGMLAAKNAD